MTPPANRAARCPPRRLGRADFNRPTLAVARGLLGKFIVRETREGRIEAMITETEAYKGPRDQACHARNGRRTARVEPLYGEGGTAYVYLVYGIHWLLNFSTAGAEKPEGVLIRAVAVLDKNGAMMPVIGPGRVTQFLKIDKSLDGLDVAASKEIWLEDRGAAIPRGAIKTGPRVGVDYAGEHWAAKPWRFWIETERAPARPRVRPTSPRPARI